MAFVLPPGITSQQQPTEAGWVYTFSHHALGELGRICIDATPEGQCRIAADVVGDAADPMTAKREAIFRPLCEQITCALRSALGNRQTDQARPTAEEQPK